jgi:hypothetical protein
VHLAYDLLCGRFSQVSLSDCPRPFPCLMRTANRSM